VIRLPLGRRLPPPAAVHRLLGEALREVQLLRGLLRLSQRAAEYRHVGRLPASKNARRGVGYGQ
jgi:hypothetical protein